MSAQPVIPDDFELHDLIDAVRASFLEVERRADALADEKLDSAVCLARAGILEAADRVRQLRRVDLELLELLEWERYGTPDQLDDERYGRKGRP